MANSRFLYWRERRTRIEAAMAVYSDDDYPNGLTWYALAKRSNMSQRTLQRMFKEPYRNEMPNPTLKSLKAVAIALGVTIGYLTDRKET